MSELTNTNNNRVTVRWKLLTSASALALATYVSSTMLARAEGPLVWLELDGQYSQQENGADAFAPPFLSASPFDGISHLDVEKGPQAEWDRGAKLSFQPEGSDWLLSLGVHYGKSSRNDVREGHPAVASNKYSGTLYSAYQRFVAQSSEGHVIVDFQVGKDVGIGSFGSGGSSVLSAGLRIAQFSSRSHVDIKSQPTNLPTGLYQNVNKFYASFGAARRFTGIGPSLSWDASATALGNPADGSITLDWGLNGALLFGRQRVKLHHQTSQAQFYRFGRTFAYQKSSSPPTRSKNVTVPNLGGFAGVSWRYPNAKISIGYRADFFFGAMDGGIDAAHRENVGFYGPFASVSIGIGG